MESSSEEGVLIIFLSLFRGIPMRCSGTRTGAPVKMTVYDDYCIGTLHS